MGGAAPTNRGRMFSSRRTGKGAGTNERTRNGDSLAVSATPEEGRRAPHRLLLPCGWLSAASETTQRVPSLARAASRVLVSLYYA